MNTYCVLDVDAFLFEPSNLISRAICVFHTVTSTCMVANNLPYIFRVVSRQQRTIILFRHPRLTMSTPINIPRLSAPKRSQRDAKFMVVRTEQRLMTDKGFFVPDNEQKVVKKEFNSI
jgi:hypothetical protein